MFVFFSIFFEKFFLLSLKHFILLPFFYMDENKKSTNIGFLTRFVGITLKNFKKNDSLNIPQRKIAPLWLIAWYQITHRQYLIFLRQNNEPKVGRNLLEKQFFIICKRVPHISVFIGAKYQEISCIDPP